MRQMLRQRFLGAGLVESALGDPSPTPDLFFQGEGTSVRVIILDESLWTHRQAFMDSIMKASAVAGKSNRTYLALPKTAASIADARLFHERGIGLFTYDHRNVEEALPARYFEMTTATVPKTDRAATDQFSDEIRELRAQIDTLERTVQSLSEELMALRRGRSRAESLEMAPPARALPPIAAADNLPTYFAGNPWVEVLSRRGTEGARIAH